MKTTSDLRRPNSAGAPAPAVPWWKASVAPPDRRPASRPGLWLLLLVLALLQLALPARAVLPEPDNVLFGSIVRDGLPITAADTDVVVEVRRAPTGPAIARYAMGSNARLGDRYSVRVKLESLNPLLNADATQTNDRIYVVATDFNGDFSSTNLVMGARGTLRLLNLGGSVVSGGDSDSDGLPDAWELARFGTIINGPGTVGGNGQTALWNYVTGSDPNDPADAFRLTMARGGTVKSVSYFARAASGPGYEGLTRSYSLEYATNLNALAWRPVSGQTNITGNNTTISYPTAEVSTNAIYRGQVRLLRP